MNRPLSSRERKIRRTGSVLWVVLLVWVVGSVAVSVFQGACTPDAPAVETERP